MLIIVCVTDSQIQNKLVVVCCVCRDIALRMIPDALQSVSSFSDLELLLSVVFALAIDYGMELSVWFVSDSTFMIPYWIDHEDECV